MVSPILPALGQQRPTVPPDKLAADVIQRLDQAVAERRVWNIHGLLVLQNRGIDRRAVLLRGKIGREALVISERSSSRRRRLP